MRFAPGCSLSLLLIMLVASPLTAGETATDLDRPRPWLERVPQATTSAKNPYPLDKSSVGKGKEAYENTCVSCHGTKGKGDGPAATYIDPRPKPLHSQGKLPLPDGVMFWVITNGIDGTGMASLEQALTEEERWHVINYLHAMARFYAPRAAPTAAPTEAPTEEPTAKPVATQAGSESAPEATPEATPEPVSDPDATVTPL